MPCRPGRPHQVAHAPRFSGIAQGPAGSGLGFEVDCGDLQWSRSRSWGITSPPHPTQSMPVELAPANGTDVYLGEPEHRLVWRAIAFRSSVTEPRPSHAAARRSCSARAGPRPRRESRKCRGSHQLERIPLDRLVLAVRTRPAPARVGDGHLNRRGRDDAEIVTCTRRHDPPWQRRQTSVRWFGHPAQPTVVLPTGDTRTRAAAWRATSSCVRSAPTMPRMPETKSLAFWDMRKLHRLRITR